MPSSNECQRLIHTGFYTDKAEHILVTLTDHMKIFLSRQAATKRACWLRSIAVIRNDDNEVCFNCMKFFDVSYMEYRNAFYGYTDQAVLLEIGRTLKAVFLNYIVYGNEEKLRRIKAKALCGRLAWSRDNASPVYDNAHDVGHNFAVNDVYCIYDAFVGRNNISRKYKKEVIDGIYGKPLDPIAIEAKKSFNEDIKNLEKKLVQARNEINEEYKDMLNAFYTKLNIEKQHRIQAITDDITSKINELKKNINEICEMAVMA